jgi:hypothetical protein
MRRTSLDRRIPSTAGMIPWLLNLATRMLACALNMPEPLLKNTGAFVFARVQAAENSIGKTLCPFRLLRRFQTLIQGPRHWSSR